jgi:hypothetical protein
MNTKPLTYNKIDNADVVIISWNTISNQFNSWSDLSNSYVWSVLAGTLSYIQPETLSLFYIFDTEIIKGSTIDIKFPCVVRMSVGSNEVVFVSKNNVKVLTIGKEFVVGDYFVIKVNDDKLFFTQYADNLVSRFITSSVNRIMQGLFNVAANFYTNILRLVLTNPVFNVIQNFITNLLRQILISNNSKCVIKVSSKLCYSESLSRWYERFCNNVWTDRNYWCDANSVIRGRYLISEIYKATISYNNPKQVWWQWFTGDIWSARGTWV